MSCEPRNSAARRRRLAEGRARGAVLVAGACVVAAAGGGTSALARGAAGSPAVSACPVDGSSFDCAAPRKPATGTFDLADPAPAPAKTTEVAPSQGPTPVTATAPASEHDEAPAAAVGEALPRRDDPLREVAEAGSLSAKARVQAGAKDAALAKAKAAKAKVAATTAPGRSAPIDAVQTYAALPASWLSLAPLSLPAFSVEGFPIPPFLLPIYQAAAAQYSLPWEVLAAINEIETNFGRNAGISSAGAMGWMQFIYSSWERWGTDSDGDRRRDPRNPVDAIFAAARYLHDAGAGTDLPKAIFAYNHAGWYVEKVVERAREFAGLDRTLVSALTRRALAEDTRLYRAPGNPFAGPNAIEPRAGQVLLFSKRQLMRLVLRSDDIEIYPGGRQDILAGHVDRRVLATLAFLARSGLRPTVTSITSGHSLRTTAGNISAHSYGHAVDIAAINGIAIAGHQGAGSITATTLARLVQLQGYLRPNQIISLMTVDGRDNTLSMSDHDDHIHVGFPRVPLVPDRGRPADIRELVASLRAHEPHR